MNYFLFKLQFDTAVHFGGSDSALSLYTSEETLRADTLFSALCHETLVQQGKPRWSGYAKASGRASSCSAIRCRGTTKRSICPNPSLHRNPPRRWRPPCAKRLKRWRGSLCWPLTAMPKACTQGILRPMTSRKASARITSRPRQRSPHRGHQALSGRTVPLCTELRAVFHLRFSESGQDKKLHALLEGLGVTGIGGRVSTGYGKFHVVQKLCLNTPSDAQTKWLRRALSANRAPYLLLTTSLPQADELDSALKDASFQLVRRSGFMASDCVETPLKKKTQYALAAGSVLRHSYQGALYDVSLTDAHRHTVIPNRS